MSYLPEYLRRLEEWAQWFHENKPRHFGSADVRKTLEFTCKALDGLYELHAIALDAMRQIDGKPPQARERLLFTPRGLTARGDMTRFG